MVLQPFKDMTEELSGEKYVSLSKIIPMINLMNTHLDSIRDDLTVAQIINVLDSLKSNLNSRFTRIEYNAHAAIACLLDPRFKMLGFNDSTAMQTAEAELINEMNNITISKEPTNNLNSVPSTSKSSQSSVLWSKFDSKVQQQVSNQNNDAESEWSQYKLLPNVERSEDPLVF